MNLTHWARRRVAISRRVTSRAITLTTTRALSRARLDRTGATRRGCHCGPRRPTPIARDRIGIRRARRSTRRSRCSRATVPAGTARRPTTRGTCIRTTTIAPLPVATFPCYNRKASVRDPARPTQTMASASSKMGAPVHNTSRRRKSAITPARGSAERATITRRSHRSAQ